MTNETKANRIFKLALTAMDFRGVVNTDTELRLTNAELKRFAELIIEECNKAVIDYAIHSGENTSDFEDGWCDGMMYSGTVIKEHFGIE